MTVAPSDFELQRLWQDQPEVHAPVRLEELHARAVRFRKEARQRRIVSWIAIAAAAAGLLFASRFTGWMMQIGAAWTCLAGILVMWRWQSINTVEALPVEGEALVEAYRSSLIRLRDARRTVLFWRIAPILPGLVLVFLGRWFQLHARGLPVQVDHWILLGTLAGAAAGLALGYLRHQRRARMLQQAIDELDRAWGE